MIQCILVDEITTKHQIKAKITTKTY